MGGIGVQWISHRPAGCGRVLSDYYMSELGDLIRFCTLEHTVKVAHELFVPLEKYMRLCCQHIFDTISYPHFQRRIGLSGRDRYHMLSKQSVVPCEKKLPAWTWADIYKQRHGSWRDDVGSLGRACGAEVKYPPLLRPTDRLCQQTFIFT